MFLKEFGNKSDRNFGIRSAFTQVEAAAKESRRLFTKNTGLCKHESGSIGADACPVPEG
jgi:hypothetical protein